MLRIDDPELERLLHEEAARTGQSVDVVLRRVAASLIDVDEASRWRTQRIGPLARTPDELEALLARVQRIQEEIAEVPVLDRRHPDEVLYDENGLPR